MKTLLHIQMHIGHLLQRAVEEELASFGLHHGQGRMLNMIARHAPVKQTDLGRLMDVKAATISNMLKPLEKQGLIERETDAATNRAQLIRLTATGEAACHNVRCVWEGVEQRMRPALTDQELESAFPLLEKIHAALGGIDPMEMDNQLRNRRTT